MKKPAVFKIVLMLVIIFSLAACGGDSDAEAEDGGEETTTVTSITITPPAKVIYQPDEPLDLAGLVVRAACIDGTTETITSGYTISGFNSGAGGTRTVTVSYETKSADFKVWVNGLVAGAPGFNWTLAEQNTFTNNTYYVQDIVRGNNEFIAVGRGARMARSTDGISWTRITGIPFIDKGGMDAGENIQCICWGNSMYIAGGHPNKMAYSSDGENWTAINPGITDNYINYAASCPGLFIAVGINRITSSTDGINWAEVTGLPGSPDFRAVCWIGPSGFEQFAAVGGGGYIIHSADGVNWTNKTYRPSGESSSFRWRKIAWGAGKYVVVGQNGRIAYSADLSTWTDVTTNNPFTYNEIRDIVWDGSKFFAVGEGSVLAYSPDGIIWTLMDNPYSMFNESITCITYGNGKFITGGRNGRLACFYIQ